MRLLCLLIWARAALLLATARAARRVAVDGSRLVDPDGRRFRPTGFNWPTEHFHEGDGATMTRYLPGANAQRLVALKWDDATGSGDCMTSEPAW